MTEIDLNAPINTLSHKLFSDKNISVMMVRLDLIHPVISGNKFFKLHYFLQQCLSMASPSLITFGGPYSNHLAATAYAAQLYKIKATGIIRGEKPAVYSPTLEFCKDCGMQLEFISRMEYAKHNYEQYHKDSIIIPEGGYHIKGAEGASVIMDQIVKLNPTHVITSVGTATTLAGLLMKETSVKIIAVPALKNMIDIPDRLALLQIKNKPFDIWGNYHFGGYAQYNDVLIGFMNDFYRQYTIPLDFVYTAKMMYALIDKVKEDYFENGNMIACLHTGGLQGNISIQDQLIFDV